MLPSAAPTRFVPAADFFPEFSMCEELRLLFLRLFNTISRIGKNLSTRLTRLGAFVSFPVMNQFIRSFMPLLIFAGNVSAGTSELVTSGDWSVAGNWSPAAVPQMTDDASIRFARWAVVSGNIGSVKSLVIGDSAAEGALNLHPGGVLNVLNSGGISVLIAGPSLPYPSFYSHSAGSMITQGNFVVGDTGLAGDAFFSSGTLTVGGSLRVGSAAGSRPSVFRLNGGGGTVSAKALDVGAAGTFEFNFLGGNSLKTLTVANAINLQAGATLMISNAGAVGPATYTLIDGATLAGTFTNVELRGFNGESFPTVSHDSGSGNVLLVVDGPDAVFNNFGGDYVWSNSDNWRAGIVPATTDKASIVSNLIVDTEEATAYLSVGNSYANAALNLYPGGSLTLTRPGISMIVGGAANGPGYPNYYSHAAGSLTTAGDVVLGANGAKVEAFFSSGSISVGGTIRLGSYQSSGAALWELRGGGGSITAGAAEIGAAGTLAFDFLGGNSLKTMTVAGATSIKAGATLTIKGAAAVGPATYTLIQGGELKGVFDQVNFTGFQSSVTPRLWYDAAAGDLKLVVESAGNAAGPIGGFSKVVPVGTAGYSFGTAADGNDVFLTDYNAGTLTRLRGNISTVVLSGYPGIYGVAAKGGKIYFATGSDSNCSVYGATLTDGIPGTVNQLATGFVRVRQLFVESSGSLLAAIEGEGRIVRINPVTHALTNAITGLSVPQAAVSDSAGNLYFTEYGLTGPDGTPLANGIGKLWKQTPNGQRLLLHETWRARGLILLSNTWLGLLAEANRADQGNSSTMVVITTEGEVTDFLQGFDYSEFGATKGFMQGLTTCPRDRAILSFLPENSGGSDIPVGFRSGVSAVATVKGQVFTSAQPSSRAVTLTGLAGGSVVLHVRPDLQGRFAGWIRINASEWPTVPTTELRYPDPAAHVFTPGVYPVPDLGVVTDGRILHDQVFAQRSQGLSRWPMMNIGTPSEAPQPGFSETPNAYMAFLDVEFDSETVTFSNSTEDGLWATAGNWNPAGLPGALNKALISGKSAFIDAGVGTVSAVTVGNSAGNAALNIYPDASLTAGSITVGSVNNASSYPNYYSHAAGSIATTGDFIFGSNGASSQSFFSSGSLAIGGTLRLGSHASAGASVLELRGGGGSISAGSVEIGAAGTLVFDFLGGNSLKTLMSNGSINLLAGSALSLANASSVGPATYVLLRGDSLQGTFSSFSIAGLPSQYQAAIEYDTVAGEVRVVVSAQDLPGFNQWSGTSAPPTAGLLLKYTIGGATSPSLPGEPSQSALDAAKLSLIAIVRTDDPALTVIGEASTTLGGWSSAGVTFTTSGISQTGVPAGAERRKYSVDRNGNYRLFLRLRATYPVK